MKKLLGCFLCVMLLVLGAALGVQAYPIDPIAAGHIASYDGTYLGGTDDLVAYGWSDYPTYHPDQDRPVNVSKVVELWNAANDPDYALPTTPYIEVDTGYPIDYTGGTISWSGEYQFLSMKWDGVFGIWDVSGLSEFDFSGLAGNNPKGNALSHYRLWNPSSVSEPATMFLLGTGLICLALFGRQRFKK